METREQSLMTIEKYLDINSMFDPSLIKEGLNSLSDEELAHYSRNYDHLADRYANLMFSGGDDPKQGYGGKVGSAEEYETFKDAFNAFNYDLSGKLMERVYSGNAEELAREREARAHFNEDWQPASIAFLAEHMRDYADKPISEERIEQYMSGDDIRLFSDALQSHISIAVNDYRQNVSESELFYSAAEFHWAKDFEDILENGEEERRRADISEIRETADLWDGEVSSEDMSPAEFLDSDTLHEYAEAIRAIAEYPDGMGADTDFDKLTEESGAVVADLKEDIRNAAIDFLEQYTRLDGDDIEKASDPAILNAAIAVDKQMRREMEDFLEHSKPKEYYEDRFGKDGMYARVPLEEHKQQVIEHEQAKDLFKARFEASPNRALDTLCQEITDADKAVRKANVDRD